MKRLINHVEFVLKIMLLPFLNYYSKINAKWVYRKVTIKDVYFGHYVKR